MSMFSVEEYQIPELDEGLYQGKLVRHTEELTDFGDGDPKEQLVLHFEIPEFLESDSEFTARYYVTKFKVIRPGSKAKLAKTLIALNGGEELPVGWQGDIEDFYGAWVTLDMVIAESKKGRTYWKVNDVRKPQRRNAQRTQARRPASTEDDLPFD